MKSVAEKIFASALGAVDPYHAVKAYTDQIRTVYGKGGLTRLLVIGFGKASPPMARAMEDAFGDLIETGLIITKYGHAGSHGLTKIRVCEAGHPVPDANGIAATEELVRLAGAAGERTLVVALISGGGSALFLSPAEGITLAEKQQVTSQLLRAGADINELNCVRKHLSRVKGGRFAEVIRPATNISLILSDVLGDRLDVIASGPTSPDSTTYGEALAVLAKFDLTEQVPQSIMTLLNKGKDGVLPETPKAADPIFQKMENIIIGSNRLALDAAKVAAEAAGLQTEIISSAVSGEAREIGIALARKALALKRSGGNHPPLCLISGGETTVTVKGAGKGGRNMELALAFAMEIEGTAGITLLSAGTDGNDGPTDAAGAVVDGVTVAGARAQGCDPAAYLQNNDSYNFFRENGGLFITGPTGTNVMDVQLIIIE